MIKKKQLAFLYSAQMQHEQVGDALVLVKRQAERWFRLAAGFSVSVDVTVLAIYVPIYSRNMAIYSVRNVICKREKKKKVLKVTISF